MKYIASYHIRGQGHSKVYGSFAGAVRFLCRGMEDGSLWPGEVMDWRGRTVVSHERIMRYWLDVVTGEMSPGDLAAAEGKPDQ